MVKQELLEQIIDRTDIHVIVELFDSVFTRYIELTDSLLSVLDINYVEPYEDETDAHWLNRIKLTEYGIVESFCNSCNKRNTQSTLEIATNKHKLVELFNHVFGIFESVKDARNQLSNSDILNENHFSTLNDILYALSLDEF